MILPNGDVRFRRRAINALNHAHELTCSCHGRLKFLDSDRTREWLIESLDAARKKQDFEVWAYVIMPEHFHVLVWPRREEYSIASILKAIKQPVGQRAVSWVKKNAPEFLPRMSVTDAAGSIEHRFWLAGGGFDRNMPTSEACWNAANYFHQNPVKRGLVAAPIEWGWSSAAWYAGERDVPLLMDRKAWEKTEPNTEKGRSEEIQ